MLTIYKASAGSGKTYTLAYRYIETLLGIKLPGEERYVLNSDRYAPGGRRQANRHRGILAITFTNAATEEMKSRIVKELDILATSDSSPYLRDLMESYGCLSEELRKSAATALAEILYDYGNFNVSTIDSFFQTVLRTFSREVDHQGDYELSLNLNEVLIQSVSLMLDDLNYAKPSESRVLREFIRDYTFNKLGEGKSYNFFNRNGALLTKLSSSTARALGEEIYVRNSDTLRDYLSDPSRVERFENALKEAIRQCRASISAAARDFNEFRLNAGIPENAYNRYINPLIDKAIANPETLDKATLDSATFIMMLDPGPDLTPFYVSSRLKANMRFGSDLNALIGKATDFARIADDSIRRAMLYGEIIEALPLLRFMGMAEEYMRGFLRDNNTILISDTGDLLRRIISDSEMPFIYERLGMQLGSLLIDEFQDTSHMQWHNLRPLVANSIDQDNDSLIIGDEKQAIYRFRNSDSELLGHIVGEIDFPDRRIMRGTAPKDNTNHRSAHGIVRFNNTLFRRLADILGVSGYENVVQTPAPRKKSATAYVRLSFADMKNTSADEILEEMARDILRQHDNGYAWRDILILTRQLDEAKTVAEFLMTHYPQISILSNEALMLNSSPAIRTIMSLLKLVEQSYAGRQDKTGRSDAPVYASQSDVVMMISRFNYFRSCGVSSEDALRLALDNDADASEALNRHVMDIRAKNPANIVAMIEAIIALKISPEQRVSEYAYISALQDLAVAHSEQPDPSLSAFVEEYERNIDKWAIKASNDIDAVEIMTIHKSKGLERACVHIPFSDWRLTIKRPELWLPFGTLPGFDDETVPPLLRAQVSSSSVLKDSKVSPFASFLEENDRAVIIDNLNLLYVAYTRASRELCVHSGLSNTGEWLINAVTRPADGAETGEYALIDISSHYDSENAVLTIGEPTTAGEKDRDEASQAIDSGEYRVFFRPDTGALTSIDDALSTDLDIGGEVNDDIVDELPPFAATPEMEEAARRGNDIHSILASTRTIADLPAAVARARGNISAADRAMYLDELTKAFEAAGETVARWFDPVNKVYTERSIYVADTGESFRPDRVVVSPDGKATVIDYKFTSRTSRNHIRQVELYVSLMRRLGRKEVEGYVWYPLMAKIIKV